MKKLEVPEEWSNFNSLVEFRRIVNSDMSRKTRKIFKRIILGGLNRKAVQPLEMIAKTNSCTVLGIGAQLIKVEVDVSIGLSTFNIVGLPVETIKECLD